MDAPVPWGEDTLFTLEFRPTSIEDNGQENAKSEGGHYALHTCNNKYLARDGKLLDSCTRDCLYAAEFHAGLLALRLDLLILISLLYYITIMLLKNYITIIK